jgi:putative ABC transport system substrate-binding protein
MVGQTAQDGKEHTRQGDAGRPLHRLNRRELVLGARRWSVSAAGLALLGGCQMITVPTLTPNRLRRIGYLSAGTQGYASAPDYTIDQLRQLGWVQGENLAVEWRFSDGRLELLPALAAELVRLPVDLIIAASTAPTLAAMQQTTTIPIVFEWAIDPLGGGLVNNLSHPGGNVTGVTYGGATISIKSVELVKTVLPQMGKLAILGDHSSANYTTAFLQPATDAAHELGVEVIDLDVHGADEVDRALEVANARGAEALYLVPLPNFQAGVNDLVAELAAQDHVAVIVGSTALPHPDGLLMAYGPNTFAVANRCAVLVDKILRGANAGDIPVEDPQAFDFVVYVKAAQALGITFPPDAAAQVTQWVQ